MSVKTGVTYGQLVQQINNELDLKQNQLVPGAYIHIDPETNEISADYEKVSWYPYEFDTSDFVEGALIIPAEDEIVGSETVTEGHGCGNNPILRQIQEYDTTTHLYSNVMVDFMVNSSGDVTIKANPFKGRLIIDSPHANAVDLQDIVSDILTGTVGD